MALRKDVDRVGHALGRVSLVFRPSKRIFWHCVSAYDDE